MKTYLYMLIVVLAFVAPVFGNGAGGEGDGKELSGWWVVLVVVAFAVISFTINWIIRRRKEKRNPPRFKPHDDGGAPYGSRDGSYGHTTD